MKQLLAVLIILALALTPIIGNAAGPLKIDATAEKVHLAVDKNAQSYARIIFKQDMVVEGIKINVDTMLLCFGDTYKDAKAIRPGEKFSVIAKPSHYKGNINYQALKFIK